ncbi:MAG: hypothetical protein ACLS76_00400 [Eubacterium callanderi]
MEQRRQMEEGGWANTTVNNAVARLCLSHKPDRKNKNQKTK